MISRRVFVAGSALLGAGGPAHAGAGPRVVAAGWAAAQTLLALGVAPLALPEIARYRSLVVEPPVPPDTRELGLRSEPSLELLKFLAPDLIVTEAGTEVARPMLERIAPVETFTALRLGRRPTEVAREATVALAARLGRPAAAEAYLAAHDDRMRAVGESFSAYRGGPLCLVSDIFGNRALVFGRTSPYQDVLDRAGIRNAFSGATSLWGHATVGLEVLAALEPSTRLVILTSRIPDVNALLMRRPLWRALPFLRSGRVTLLSDILFYGGLPSADRFARLLTERLPLDSDDRG